MAHFPALISVWDVNTIDKWRLVAQVTFRCLSCYAIHSWTDEIEEVLGILSFEEYTTVWSRHNKEPLLLTHINLIPAWISAHIPSKVMDEMTYPLANGMVNHFISHYIMDEIIHPGWDYS